MTDCTFCRIVSGDIPATIVARTDEAAAFRDLNPQAPVHVLVIPTGHYATATEAGTAGPQVLGAVTALAVQAAHQLGVADSGFRLVINSGRDGGQTVDHLHVHLLAGRQMNWPPG